MTTVKKNGDRFFWLLHLFTSTLGAIAVLLTGYVATEMSVLRVLERDVAILKHEASKGERFTQADGRRLWQRIDRLESKLEASQHD